MRCSTLWGSSHEAYYIQTPRALGARGVLCAEHKRLLIVPRAGHGLSYMLDREAYLAALREFLEAN